MTSDVCGKMVVSWQFCLEAVCLGAIFGSRTRLGIQCSAGRGLCVISGKAAVTSHLWRVASRQTSVVRQQKTEYVFARSDLAG